MVHLLAVVVLPVRLLLGCVRVDLGFLRLLLAGHVACGKCVNIDSDAEKTYPFGVVAAGFRPLRDSLH